MQLPYQVGDLVRDTGYMDGQTDRQTGWIDRWIDWMDGQMDGQTDKTVRQETHTAHAGKAIAKDDIGG